ncbi:MAG: PKD domain-containing protein [Saprospiraceae bacterium]|nr:PKD domain-containing protein [Saprospiraceae bacterium]
MKSSQQYTKQLLLTLLLGQITLLAQVPSSILSPVTGGNWVHNQHRTGGHTSSGGIGGCDDTYAWDSNLNTPVWNSDDGKPVYPVADGVIITSITGWGGTSYGQILIEHTNSNGTKWYSGYLHMKNITRVNGQFVTKNTVIGNVSNISPSTLTSHLHFAVYNKNSSGKLISANATIYERSDGVTPPTLFTPTADEISLTMPVFFDWNTVTGADAYRIQVSRSLSGWSAQDGWLASSSNPTYNVPVNIATGTSSQFSWSNVTSGVYAAPESHTSYYWSVRVNVPGSGASDYTSPRKFTMDVFPPQLISPSNNATSISPPIPFDWSAISNADAYRIQVSKSLAGWTADNGWLGQSASPTADVPVNSSTGNISNFSWSNATTGVYSTPLPNTTYYWSVRGNVPGFGSSAFTTPIKFTTYSCSAPSTPSVSATSTTICAGQTTNLSVLNACSGCSYTWSNGQTGTSISVSSAASYSVRATNSCGTSGLSNTVSIVSGGSAPSTPSVSATSTTICAGQTTNLSVLNACSGCSYTWSNGQTGTSISVSSAASYSVRATNSCGTSGLSNTVSIVSGGSAPSTPSVSATSTTICAGQTTNLSVLNACSGCSYTWSNGQTGTSISVSSAASYSVRATNSCGTSGLSNTVSIVSGGSAPSTPSVSATSTTICAGQTTNLSVLNACSGCSYTWSNGQTGTSISVSSAASYSVRATNSCGTSGLSNTVSIVSGGSAPSTPSVSATSTTICAGQTTNLSVLNACSGCSYTWSNGQTGTSISVSSAASYSVRATNSCGTSGLSNTVSIVSGGSAPSTPSVSATSTTICAGQTTNLSVLNACSGCSYTWSNGQTGTSISVSSAASYSVRATNSCGTSGLSNTVSIVSGGSAPSTPSVSATSTTICAGQTTNLSVLNACSGCSYTWSNGQTGTSISVSSAASYSVRATNSCGTSGLSNTVSIVSGGSAPSTPSVSATSTTICAGQTTNLSVLNACSGCSYTWSNGQTGTSISVSSAASYSVRATNSCGTSGLSNTVSIVSGGSAPSTPSVSATSTTICAGQTTNLSVLNACSGCSYTWSNGQTGTSISVSSAASYSVRATNSCGTSGLSNTVSIVSGGSAPSTPSVSATSTTICAGQTTNLSVLNACSGCSYTWSNGQTGTSISVSSAASYSVRATNSCGTSGLSNTVSIVSSGNVSITSIAPQSATCGISNGSITVTATGTGLQYSLNNGAYLSNNVFSGLAAGLYTIIVKNANGCTATQQATVTNSGSAVSITSITPQSATCGGMNGSLTVIATGTGLQYSLNNGAYLSDNVFRGLAAGLYTVIVKDANGCTATQQATVTNSGSAVSITSITPQSATCGGMNGSLTVIATGTGLQYSLNNGAYLSDNVFRGLAAGLYTVIVKDANGCTATQQATVTNSGSAVSITSITPQSATCGGMNGSLTVIATGTGLQYSLNNGAYLSDNVFRGLAAGLYTVIVKDANGCTATQQATVTNSGSAVSITSITPQSATCGSMNGSLTVTATGTGLQYALNNGTYQTSNVFSNLAAGVYTVTIKDANGCTATQQATVTNSGSAVSITSVTPQSATCGSMNGSLTVTATGTGLQYSLNNGAYLSDNVFRGLAAGLYTVIVKDANGCTATQQATVTNSGSAVSITSVTPQSATCGSMNGSLTVTATGTGLQYALNNGAYQTSNVFSNLAAGTYTVTIKDANGCTATQQVSVTNSGSAASITSVTPQSATCGSSNGSLTVVATGTGLQYALNNGTYQTSNVFSNLAAGTYTVTIKDANGCTARQQVSVTNSGSAASITSVTPQSATCGSSNGSLTVVATGTGLQYALNNGTYQTSNVFSNLAVGVYTVTIKDANGCTATQQATVTNSGSAVSITSITPQSATCGGMNGSLTVTATGTGLQYALDNGAYQTSNVFTNLAAATYTVKIKDANGCTATQQVSVNNLGSNATITSVTPQPATCENNNGSIVVSAIGLNLQYALNGGPYQTSHTFINLGVGSYTVSVKDGNNCIINSQPVSVTNIGVAPIANFTSNATNLSATFTNTSTNGVTYNWNFGNSITSTLQNPNVTFATAGTYNVCLVATNTCASRQICQPITVSCVHPNVAITGNTNICQGSSTTLTATGSASYLWSNGATTPSVTVNQSGTFTVTVTNSSGCTGTASQTVTVIPPPKADFGFTTQGGRVNLTSLSTGASSYLWRFGNDTTSTQTNPTANYRTNGTYNICLLVTNAQGCRDSICKTINITRVDVKDLPKGLSFTISPNPTKDIVTVHLDFNRPFGAQDQLILTDVLGRQVFKSQNISTSNNLNITDLANGIYFVQLLFDNKNYTLGKVVKNN